MPWARCILDGQAADVKRKPGVGNPPKYSHEEKVLDVCLATDYALCVELLAYDVDNNAAWALSSKLAKYILLVTVI